MPSYQFKIILTGDEAVGKTSAVRRFVDGTFKESYKATLGFEVSVKAIICGSSSIVFSIFDVAGQQDFQGVRAGYYQGSFGFLLMFDLTNRASFEHIPNWVDEIRAAEPNVPIILIGTKSDLPDPQVTPEEMAIACEIFELQESIIASSKTGAGVDEMFNRIGNAIIASINSKSQCNSKSMSQA
ncbi:MAG TPA: GTP-binding protein [Candidatus Lokiarchaeia archaeon]|nr:GTP-binding protein [Candidatus Lokiarchaeia archaeon]